MRGAIIRYPAEVSDRPGVEVGASDRSIELGDGGIVLSHAAHAVRDAACGEEPLRLSQSSVGELQLQPRLGLRVKRACQLRPLDAQLAPIKRIRQKAVRR